MIASGRPYRSEAILRLQVELSHLLACNPEFGAAINAEIGGDPGNHRFGTRSQAAPDPLLSRQVISFHLWRRARSLTEMLRRSSRHTTASIPGPCHGIALNGILERFNGTVRDEKGND
jgi:hypothetical protein